MPVENEIQLLTSIKSLISELNNSNVAALCFLWLTKIGEIENKEIKNDYLQRLRDNIVNNELKYPFCDSPPDGPLTQISQASKISSKSKSSSLRNDNHEINTLNLSTPSVDYVHRNEIEKYKERCKKHKLEIAKYQSMLRSAFQSGYMKNERVGHSTPETVQIDVKSLCRCDDGGSLTKTESGTNNLIEINKKLIHENEFLRKECMELKNTVEKITDTACDKKKDKKNIEQIVNKRLEETFRVELKSIVDKKDQIISDLETQLNNKTLNDITSEMLPVFEGKCQALEKSYKDLLYKEIDKHKKELKENREKIELLQNLLIEKKKK